MRQPSFDSCGAPQFDDEYDSMSPEKLFRNTISDFGVPQDIFDFGEEKKTIW